ncbi:sensor histidine kinase [Loigolactobacillus zhaoyuanensis]|uniref:histidine kinase n=1 Tax=Loigolactobacillus zhaoyuanensis TaxID=2486017 RepID=A0ABW8UF34_9LACO|nr:histidine kinase [Loigolactobacillus zhaoyuanensis]
MKENELKTIKIEMFHKLRATAIFYVCAIYCITATVEIISFANKTGNWLATGLFFGAMLLQILMVFYLNKLKIILVIFAQMVVTIGSYLLIGNHLFIIMGLAPVILLEIWNFLENNLKKIMLALVVTVFAVIYSQNIFSNFDWGRTILLLELTGFVVFAALYTQTAYTRQFIELKKSQKLFEQLEIVYDQVEQTTIEVERDRIARDFHDSIIQQIIGNLLHLEATATAMKNNKDHKKSLIEIERVIEQSRKMVVDSRLIVKDLKDDRRINLQTRIDILSSSFRKNYHLDVMSTIKGDPKFSQEIFSQLERIIHECLINVVKHANVSNVVVFGEPRGAGYCLRIIDFGTGFDADKIAKSDLNFGLRNIAERVNLIAGNFEIKSVKGEGTTIIIEVPLGGTQDDKNNDR